MKIEEIREILKNTEESCLRERLQDFSSDERGGVKKLVLQYGKKADRYEKELIRLEKCVLMRKNIRKQSISVVLMRWDEVL